MERLSKASPDCKLTTRQKKEIAELESKCAAKIAELNMFLKGKCEGHRQRGSISHRTVREAIGDGPEVTASGLGEKKSESPGSQE